MRYALRSVIALAVIMATAGFLAVPASAAPSDITVTPSTGLESGQSVTVSGSGFEPSQSFTVVQCDILDLQGGGPCYDAVPVTAADDGTFSTPYTVVDHGCATGVLFCVIELRSADGSEALDFVIISFARQGATPDVVIKRRSDGRLFYDNVRGSGPNVYQHPIAPGGYWTFAVLVQNDGNRAGDIQVTAPTAPAPLAVQYFWGYYDVTALVTGAGLTVAGLAPGAQITLAVRFAAPTDVIAGAKAAVTVRAEAKVPTPASDSVRVGVITAAP